MREIKFRVWDEGEKRFWYFLLQDILERRIVYRGSWDEKVARYKKAQYTGLKDKNSVEIYEGDIVELRLVDGIERFEVYYETDRARFSFRDLDGIDWGFATSTEMKVVGNIYEHPHLLEASE